MSRIRTEAHIWLIFFCTHEVAKIIPLLPGIRQMLPGRKW